MNRDPRSAAAEVQGRASRPDASAVLRAAAGSGKTKVLIDRLLRLMISGAPLKSVVAMTFTRKAAVEIKGRLLRRVAALARADAAARDADLSDLLGRAPSAAQSSRAAALFEELLEDSAGLHIGTIHTFCQMLLSRFADEAGADPGFAVLESEADLWREALERLERETGADAEKAEAFAGIGNNPPSARKRLEPLINARMDLDRWLDRAAAEAGADGARRTGSELLPRLAADLADSLFSGTVLAGAKPEPATLAGPLADAALELAGAGLDSVAAAEGPDASDAFGRRLRAMRDDLSAAAERLGSEPAPGVIPDLAKAVLTSAGTVRKIPGRAPTKQDRESALETAAAPLIDLLNLAGLVELYEQNVRLLGAGLRALDIYAGLKSRDRCLDFHDLERRAWELLQDFEVGMWVVYRLDERLDHLLVDEFQDTNRNQWDVMRPFVDELVASLSEAGLPRTVFLVGDVKQSIYGFRGACPELFADVAADLDRRAAVEQLTLPTNFRSLPAVVDAVGDLFTTDPLRSLLPDDSERRSVRQIPYRTGPGKVTVLPPAIDDPDGPSGQQACAAMTVRIIRRIVERSAVGTDDGDRPARYGDILVLSRNRTHLEVYEQALRRAAIPFVPPGRGALARSREVADIRLLLRWLVFPQDDPALAGVLRSPLLRVDEARLQKLLSLSDGSLWAALAPRDARHAAAALETGLEREAELLAGWRKHLGRENAHDLLRRIFRETDALDRYELALGEQARYNLLRLHDLALAHDQGSFPSPRGFLESIERAALLQDEEEAALPESDLGRVRMMTIHGAKGLEAPFVLLIDAASTMSREDPRLIDLGGRGDGPVLFGVRKEHREERGSEPTAVSLAADAAVERSRREEANLLYVAMTRARDELWILGAEPGRSREKPSYMKWIAEARGGYDEAPEWLADAARDAGLETAARAVREHGPAPAETWRPVGRDESLRLNFPSAAAPDPAAPDGPAPENIADARLAAEHSANDTESAPAGAEAAADRGTRIHLWLQRAAEAGAMPAGEGEEWEEARAVFANPAHDWIFRPRDARGFCEIPLIHRNVRAGSDVSEERTLGVIDRLLVAGDEVIVVDYKSNRVGPADIPRLAEHYRPQLDAYRAAMSAVFPGRTVRAWLLFTHVPGPSGAGTAHEVASVPPR